MGRDASHAEHVVHLVGPLQSQASHLLWPTVLALAHAGVTQTVVVLHADDADFARMMLPRQVSVRVAEARGLLGLRRRRAHVALAEAFAAGPVLAVHLHGLAATRHGIRAMHDLRLEAMVFLHPGIDFDGVPHRMALTLWAAVLRLATRLRRHLPIYVVHAQHVSPLQSLLDQRPMLLGQPVRDAYFSTERDESRAPLIVTSGREHDFSLAQAFVQIAALLAGVQPQLSFAWIGPSSDAVRHILEAGGVRVQAARTSAERAAALAQAWLYVAPDAAGADGAPLAQAMAVGVPCVVADTPACRELVIHRLGGFVCPDQAALLAGIAQLVDSASLRSMYGRAARGRALHWAGRRRRLDSLLVAHGLATPEVGA